MTEATLLKADVEARRDALDVERSFIVQAPAGSGKTELLIQRYLKLLGIVDDPEEILAITFTRKAAAEMLERVSLALDGAIAGSPTRGDHEQQTRSLALAALDTSSRLGWAAINLRRSIS